MNVRFRSSFKKDLKRIKDPALLDQVNLAIEEVKAAESISAIRNLLKLKGYQELYRIRVGNYRIGLRVTDEEVIFVRLLHRREIYRFFP